MKKIIDVFTGDVKFGDKNCELVSHAIGSCIVITVRYPEKSVGAMAHIMLPGRSCAKHKTDRYRYAEDAIDEILLKLKTPSTDYANLEVCLIGGGNVLKRKDDTICKNIISSVQTILKKKKLTICGKSLGGTKRRSVRFDIAKGEVFFRENDSNEKLLWKSDE